MNKNKLNNPIKIPYVPKDSGEIILMSWMDKQGIDLKLPNKKDFRGYQLLTPKKEIIPKKDYPVKVDVDYFKRWIGNGLLIPYEDMWMPSGHVNKYLWALKYYITEGNIKNGYHSIHTTGEDFLIILPKGNYKDMVKNKDIRLEKVKNHLGKEDTKRIYQTACVEMVKSGTIWLDMFEIKGILYRVDSHKKTMTTYKLKENISSKLTKPNKNSNPFIQDLDSAYFKNIEMFEKLLSTTGVNGEFSFEESDYYDETYYVTTMDGNKIKVDMSVTSRNSMDDWHEDNIEEYEETKELTTEEFLEFLRKRKFGSQQIKQKFNSAFEEFIKHS